MINKKFTALLAVTVGALFVHYWKAHQPLFVKSIQNNIQSPVRKIDDFSQPKMTVFIHGSFGSLLGFLSFSSVLQDKISGTFYRSVTKKMRNDGFFYKDQPILQRGLVRVEPTFDLKAVEGKKFAVYPIAKSFQAIADMVSDGKEKNYFYTFGWTGLISQKSRRFEAIRLYNALAEELENLKQQGIVPKVRLIAHSHGGNLCLNLAAINKILKIGASDEKAIYSKDPEENDALQKMVATMHDLSTKENAKSKQDQKVYDYVPEDLSLIIDELILYGVPIQPETELFCHSHMFRRVYNFYSSEDYVQRLDWVTSKKPLSNQRISCAAVPSEDKSLVIQARLFAEKPVHNGKMKIAKKPVSPKQEKTVFEELIEGRNIFVRHSKDPTHKELWCMQWGEAESPFVAAINPLPVVILTPLLLQALDQAADVFDADIDIEAAAQYLRVHVAQRDQDIIKKTVQVSRQAVAALKHKAMAWKPESISPQDDFNAIYKYVSQ